MWEHTMGGSQPTPHDPKVVEARRVLLHRLRAVGFTYRRLRGIATTTGLEPYQVLDVFLKVQHEWEHIYGRARYTGNTRVYATGVVGYETRCSRCGQPFWQTGLPYALCPSDECGGGVRIPVAAVQTGK